MKEIQWERVAAILLSVALGSVGVFLFVQYALPVLLPFLLAYLLSLLILPLSRRLSTLLHLPQKLVSCTLLTVLILGGAYLLWVLAVKLCEEAGVLIGQLLRDGTLTKTPESIRLWLSTMAKHLGIDLLSDPAQFEKALYDLLYSSISSLASRLPELLSSLFSALPAVFLLVAITLVAGFYLCSDGERITAALTNALPPSCQSLLLRLKKGAKTVFLRYLRAYLYLFLLTFSLLLVGFLILGVKYTLLLAFVIAFADLLPVLGVGTVLVPWGLVAILQKNYYLGFGLLILYLVISLIRQFTEPRLIGKSLGLHPLLALFASYAGFLLFGFWGMLLAPLAAIVVKSLVGVPRHSS